MYLYTKTTSWSQLFYSLKPWHIYWSTDPKTFLRLTSLLFNIVVPVPGSLIIKWSPSCCVEDNILWFILSGCSLCHQINEWIRTSSCPCKHNRNIGITCACLYSLPNLWYHDWKKLFQYGHKYIGISCGKSGLIYLLILYGLGNNQFVNSCGPFY